MLTILAETLSDILPTINRLELASWMKEYLINSETRRMAVITLFGTSSKETVEDFVKYAELPSNYTVLNVSKEDSILEWKATNNQYYRRFSRDQLDLGLGKDLF